MLHKHRWLIPMLMLVASRAQAEQLPVDAGDTAWVLTATALVLFMTVPGLSLFYAGLVRSKNVLSVLMQCFVLVCLMSLVWFAVGYTIAFGSAGVEQGRWVGDFGNLFLSKISMDSVTKGIPETLFVMFHMTFAIIAPALIVGGFAERMKFSAMLIFSSCWLVLVYAPVCHWVRGGGWLQEIGLQDFAGGTTIHITAGVAALVAAMIMGPRKGFGSVAMPPHNLTLTVTGAGMLWVGWFGFNAGSAAAANSSAAMAMLVTHLSASTGALAWMATEWIRTGKPSVMGTVTGMVAGLGAITPAAGSVGPAAAVVIGFTAGVLCYFVTKWIKHELKIDDSLDVFPVHGFGGLLGSLLVGVFCSTQLGIFSGNGFSEGISSISGQMMVQVVGVLATLVYSGVISAVLLKFLDVTLGLRVHEEAEVHGLDLVLHDEQGYDL